MTIWRVVSRHPRRPLDLSVKRLCQLILILTPCLLPAVSTRRKARITKEDLLQHCSTPGCPGFIAAQGDGSRQFRRHTDECRRRMTEVLPETRQKLATDRSNQWITEQVEKSGPTMADTRAPLQGALATASGSGLTSAEREAGRSTDGNQDAAAIDVDIELGEAPGDEPGLRNRVMTPDRAPRI